MRLIRISAPAGTGADVAKIAFSVGIGTVSVTQAQSYGENGETKSKEMIDIETSTPKGGAFVEKLLTSSIYDHEEFTVNIRQPRAIVSKEGVNEVTKPFVEPATDVLEELWQFCHITASFVVRVFISSMFIAYGMIEQQTLLIIAGLLFLPLLPVLLSISFGIWMRQWKLVGKAIRFFSQPSPYFS